MSDADLRKALYDVCFDPENKDRMADMMKFSVDLKLRRSVTKQQELIEMRRSKIIKRIADKSSIHLH